ncbi:hypothetical protein R84981_001136 [Carnimonas sp. R-84981]|uniref:phage tail protein n=1 Tax=Carnimonas bestiolae TaxID=3402172 RepID=UPI003EDBE3BE
MMMILGQFVFQRVTVPYQQLQRSSEYRHPAQERIGQRPARQFVGPGEDTITLTGELLPEFTGGRLTFDQLRKMADSGKAWPLIEATGRMYGWWVIGSIEETSSEFMVDGLAQRIEFSMTLSHVDNPSVNDLGQQELNEYTTGTGQIASVGQMAGMIP